MSSNLFRIVFFVKGAVLHYPWWPFLSIWDHPIGPPTCLSRSYIPMAGCCSSPPHETLWNIRVAGRIPSLICTTSNWRCAQIVYLCSHVRKWPPWLACWWATLVMSRSGRLPSTPAEILEAVGEEISMRKEKKYWRADDHIKHPPYETCMWLSAIERREPSGEHLAGRGNTPATCRGHSTWITSPDDGYDTSPPSLACFLLAWKTST